MLKGSSESSLESSDAVEGKLQKLHDLQRKVRGITTKLPKLGCPTGAIVVFGKHDSRNGYVRPAQVKCPSGFMEKA